MISASLLADDQALVRAGFRVLFDAEADIEVVGVASNGREAIELARATAPAGVAHGHPHAGDRWHRGDPPDRR